MDYDLDLAALPDIGQVPLEAVPRSRDDALLRTLGAARALGALTVPNAASLSVLQQPLTGVNVSWRSREHDPLASRAPNSPSPSAHAAQSGPSARKPATTAAAASRQPETSLSGNNLQSGIPKLADEELAADGSTTASRDALAACQGLATATLASTMEGADSKKSESAGSHDRGNLGRAGISPSDSSEDSASDSDSESESSGDDNDNDSRSKGTGKGLTDLSRDDLSAQNKARVDPLAALLSRPDALDAVEEDDGIDYSEYEGDGNKITELPIPEPTARTLAEADEWLSKLEENPHFMPVINVKGNPILAGIRAAHQSMHFHKKLPRSITKTSAFQQIAAEPQNNNFKVALSIFMQTVKRNGVSEEAMKEALSEMMTDGLDPLASAEAGLGTLPHPLAGPSGAGERRSSPTARSASAGSNARTRKNTPSLTAPGAKDGSGGGQGPGVQEHSSRHPRPPLAVDGAALAPMGPKRKSDLSFPLCGQGTHLDSMGSMDDLKDLMMDDIFAGIEPEPRAASGTGAPTSKDQVMVPVASIETMPALMDMAVDGRAFISAPPGTLASSQSAASKALAKAQNEAAASAAATVAASLRKAASKGVWPMPPGLRPAPESAPAAVAASTVKRSGSSASTIDNMTGLLEGAGSSCGYDLASLATLVAAPATALDKPGDTDDELRIQQEIARLQSQLFQVQQTKSTGSLSVPSGWPGAAGSAAAGGLPAHLSFQAEGASMLSAFSSYNNIPPWATQDPQMRHQLQQPIAGSASWGPGTMGVGPNALPLASRKDRQGSSNASTATGMVPPGMHPSWPRTGSFAQNNAMGPPPNVTGRRSLNRPKRSRGSGDVPMPTALVPPTPAPAEIPEPAAAPGAVVQSQALVPMPGVAGAQEGAPALAPGGAGQPVQDADLRAPTWPEWNPSDSSAQWMMTTSDGNLDIATMQAMLDDLLPEGETNPANIASKASPQPLTSTHPPPPSHLPSAMVPTPAATAMTTFRPSLPMPPPLNLDLHAQAMAPGAGLGLPPGVDSRARHGAGSHNNSPRFTGALTHSRSSHFPTTGATDFAQQGPTSNPFFAMAQMPHGEAGPNSWHAGTLQDPNTAPGPMMGMHGPGARLDFHRGPMLNMGDIAMTSARSAGSLGRAGSVGQGARAEHVLSPRHGHEGGTTPLSKRKSSALKVTSPRQGSGQPLVPGFVPTHSTSMPAPPPHGVVQHGIMLTAAPQAAHMQGYVADPAEMNRGPEHHGGQRRRTTRDSGDGDPGHAMGSAGGDWHTGDAEEGDDGMQDETELVIRTHMGQQNRKINKAMLQQVYHLPINEAAEQLGIGVTVLKKYCRRFQIERWPYRKLKSMDKLIQSVEEQRAADPQGTSFVLAKLHKFKQELYNNPEACFDDAIKKLRQANFKMEYKQRQALNLTGAPSVPPVPGAGGDELADAMDSAAQQVAQAAMQMTTGPQAADVQSPRMLAPAPPPPPLTLGLPPLEETVFTGESLLTAGSPRGQAALARPKARASAGAAAKTR